MIAGAQDFDNLKIYINPGHGGYDSNDRYIAATGFWESESNLTKGLYLRDLLENLNAEVFMSRTQNRTEDDLPLSVIDADANANNVDFFHSIHSNGFQGNANYTLMLYKETNGSPVDPLSRDMGTIMSNEIKKAHRTYASYNRGDYSFLGFNLGVLNYLNYNIMHGTLSEGSFHDYIPESWRLMSIDYRKHEAVAILRSFIDFYNLDPLPHGIVAGLVRAKNQNVLYDYSYISQLPNDRKKALNNARITLMPDSLVYITDGNHNGFFMFDSLEPGDYTVIFEHGEYQSDTAQVTVQANNTVFADAFLAEDPDKAPYVNTHIPAAGSENIITHADLEIIFSRPMAPSSVDSAFSVAPSNDGTFGWEVNDQKLVFTPGQAFETGTLYTVTIDTGARSIYGINMTEPYIFTFTTADDHVYPAVISSEPSATSDSVSTYTEITLTFDMEMKQQETEEAFQITPQTDGTFSWENDSKTMTFTPDSALQKASTYEITVSTSALNRYGIPLEEAFAVTFDTRVRNELSMLASFPADHETDISTGMEFYLHFDYFVLTETIGNKIRLYTADGDYTRTTSPELFLDGNGPRSFLKFAPRQPLEKHTDYRLTILPGIKDYGEFELRDTVYIHFRTENETYAGGNVLEDFENEPSWLNPDSSETTVGNDPLKTFYRVTTKEFKNGEHAGELQYAFTDTSGGAVRLQSIDGYATPDNPESLFGMWCYGDYTFNQLEWWFSVGGEDIVTIVDTLDWMGWKLIDIPLSDVTSESGVDIAFHSLVIRQLDSARKSGGIFFDDIQGDIETGLEQFFTSGPVLPQQSALYQNFPNPFNPTTTIRYSLASAGNVELSIYNVRGQKIQTLVRNIQQAGEYTVKWDASGFASGVYVYTLEYNGMKQSRKLLLLK